MVLERLSVCWLKTGRPNRAIEALKSILLTDPWREDIYRHLMIAQVRSGNRTAALQWYDRCVQVLDEEFHIGPEPETRWMYERICAGEDIQDI
jgi:DNA-binding SARP family transcriptional activator